MTELIENKKKLASLLKKRRKELKISQAELAKLCNLSVNGISLIETGASDVQLSTLLKMSQFLGFKVALEMEE